MSCDVVSISSILATLEDAYLVLGEQCVAYSRQQHHRDQKRDEAFGRHDGGCAGEKCLD